MPLDAATLSAQIRLGLSILEQTQDPMLASAIAILTERLGDPPYDLTPQEQKCFDMITLIHDAGLTYRGLV